MEATLQAARPIRGPHGGWQKQEIDALQQSVEAAERSGESLRSVFERMSRQLGRKPNSIRNFYYARVREVPELAAKQAPLRTFTAEELHGLLRDVLMGRGQGESVRACVTRLAGGDRAGMLRYQNKYRSILKNRPEMLMEVAQELRAEGLPCPDDVLACRRYNLAGRQNASLATLEKHMGDPSVRRMVEGLTMLLERAADAPAESTDAVPYRKWAEARREADRLKVEVDLLKLALEDAQS